MARKFTPLAQKSPETAAQWDYKKNPADTTPDTVAAGSHKKFWWVCSKGHSWQATAKNRTARKSGCPYCSGRKATQETNVITTFPEFAQAMQRYGTQEIKAEDLKIASKHQAYLKCEKGHTWQASPHSYHSVKGGLCPYCSEREVLAGYNDLATKYPELAQLWDEKNNGIPASEIIARTHSSEKKYHFICEHGHRQLRTMYSAIKHPGCTVCKNQDIIVGFNDISTFAPHLYAELADEHKTQEELEKIHQHSNFKLTWVCPIGHGKYQASMTKRSSGQGCPVCAGNKLNPGINDLASIRPDLVQEWDYEKNDILPTEITSGNSNKKIWWVCDNGHSYQAPPGKRTGKNPTGCPYCANKKVLVGYNDLSTIRPDVAQRWHPDKNGDNTPEMFTFRSGFVAWWVCDKGHEWKSDIDHQSGGNSCPKCSHQVSKAEEEIADYVTSILPDTKVLTSYRKIINPYELDIYIPDLKIAIEFNGLYWHTESQGKDRNYHYNKWKKCKDQDIQLITIWEDEWRDKQDIIKSMLAHKLGVSQGKKVYARKTNLMHLEDNQQVKKFLNTYHIQGYCPGRHYVGLIDNLTGDLVAVSIWRKNKKDFYLDRYATSCTVVGGMGKMLKEGKKLAKESDCDKIITFADHQVSDGGLYSDLGFTKDKELNPDYRYVVAGERKHKFGYRLKKFRSSPDLEYQEGLTEKQLAKLNGLERIWDCGKTRWVMNI